MVDRYHCCHLVPLLKAAGLLMLAALLASPVAAELDSVQLGLLESYATGLQWENVREPPQWLHGPPPRFDASSGLWLIRLRPGSSVTVRVPPRAMVRITCPGRTVVPGDLDCWTSNGSGLYRRHVSAWTTDRRSLLLLGNEPQTTLARVVRPECSTTSLEVALFTSRRDYLPDILPYRHEVELPLPPVQLPTEDGQASHVYYRAGPASPLRLRLSGPARLAVETVLRYGSGDFEMFRSYQLRARINGQLLRILEYETGPGQLPCVHDDGQHVWLGRQEVDYLNVPPGNFDLELDPTAAVYVRLRAQRGDAFAAPGWNAPRAALARSGWSAEPTESLLSCWDLDPGEMDTLAGFDSPFVGSQELIARRAARDNRYRGGGLRAAVLLRGVAAHRADDPRVRDAAEQMLHAHTGFRDLLPVERVSLTSSRYAWFAPRRLRDPRRPCGRPGLWPQHVDDALNRLAAAHFLPIAAGPENANRYRLDPDLGDSVLRVSVDRSAGVPAPARMMVQFDDRQPVVLELVGGEPVSGADFEPSLAELALSAWNVRHQPFGGGTLGGPFSVLKTPAPLIPAATAELPLPAGTSAVRVWCEPSAQTPLVALEYRDSKTYQLGESDYLEMLRRASPSVQTLLACLADDSATIDSPDPYAAAELRNHWLPLLRLLASLQRQFTGSLGDPVAEAAPGAASQSADVEAWAADARRLAGESQWLAALEAWSRVLPCSSGALRREALLARVRALQQLGESFLAERFARALFLEPADPQLGREAFALLRDNFLQQDDSEHLLQLYATAVVQHRWLEHLHDLAGALADDGRHELALQISLLLPAGERDSETVLRCAYQLGWWHVFDTACAALPDDPQRSFWTALRDLRFGRYEQALAGFRRAGAAGQAYARHLEQGQEIYARLQGAAPADRAAEVQRWARWYAQHPGRWIWKEEPALVREYGGAELVCSVERDVAARYYRARPGEPITVSVLGPLRVKLDTRPAHAAGSDAGLEDCLIVRGANPDRAMMLIGNRVTPTVRVWGDDDRTLGSQVEPELELGGGWHRLEISGERHEHLIRVLVQRPEFALGVLPPPSRATLAHFWPGAAEPDLADSLPRDSLAARSAEPPSTAAPEQGASPPGDDWAFTAEPGSLPAPRDASANRPAEVLQQMEQLVHAAQQHPEQRMQCLVLASELLQQHPTVPGLSPLHQWLAAGGAWRPFRGVESSAGWRAVEFSGWLPESPGLRIRRALLRPLQPGEHLVINDRDLVISQDLHEPTRLELQIEAAVVPHVPPVPVTVLCQQGDDSPEPLLLRPGGPPETLWLPLPAGFSQVRLRLAQPIANHFAVVRVSEYRDGDYGPAFVTARNRPSLPPETADTGETGGRVILDEAEKMFRVATHDEPLCLVVEAPAWLRVDQWRDGAMLTRYLHVREGVQRFQLSPAAGERDALFRLYEYDLSAGASREATPSRPEIALRPIPGPLLTLRARGPSGAAFARTAEPSGNGGSSRPPDRIPRSSLDSFAASDETADEVVSLLAGALDSGDRWVWDGGLLPLGQIDPRRTPPLEILAEPAAEDGLLLVELPDPTPLAWTRHELLSCGLGYVSRRPLDEGIDVARPDRFVQLDITRRELDASCGTHQKTDLLLRMRDSSGPTLGMRHLLRHQPPCCPVTLRSEISAYLQHPADAMPPAEPQTEWSALFRGQAMYRHRLSSYVSHQPSLTIFARLMSMNEDPYESGRVDQDIFTSFKNEHRQGLILWDRWVAEPWLDTRLWVHPTLFTTEDFNIFQPDHLGVRFGWTQLLGHLELDAAFRMIRFLKTQDRTDSYAQYLLSGDLLADLRMGQRRSELLVRVEYDIERSATSLSVGLVCFGARGGREALFPEEQSFADLRRLNRAALPR